MGGFTNAISNAIAARGNALAQGELQRGQVWGNLAQNLGQLPFQAMQAHQRRNLAEVETQQRGLQNQAMQQELNFQKEMSAIMTDQSLSSEQRDQAGLNTLKKYGKLAQFEEIQARKTQTAIAKAAALKGMPGTVLPQGELGLPMPRKTESVFNALQPGAEVVQPAIRNAFERPATEAQQMVHEQIPLPGGGAIQPQTPQQIRQERINQINSADIPEHYKQLAIASLDVPPGVLSAMERGTSAPGVGLTVIELSNPQNPGETMMVQSTRGGPFVHSGTQQLVPEEIARTWHKRIVSQPKMVVGSQDQPILLDIENILANQRAAGQQVNTIPGVTVRQAAPPPTQIMTVTTPTGPELAEYKPSRKGTGTLTTVAKGTVKGTVSPISDSAQKEIAGLGTAATSLNTLNETLPKISGGPVWGTLRKVQINALGGWGTTPEEVQAATQLNLLMLSAFDTAGKNFTGAEMDIFRGIYPQQTDTVETALTKIPAALAYIKERLELRKGLMSPMQRSQTQFPNINVPGGGGGLDPQKKARLEELRRKKAAGTLGQ